MRNPTALLAEDETVLRDQLRSRLASLWPGLRIVAEAATGIEAVARFEDTNPDVVFLDIEMPGMSGLEVARTLLGRCHVVFVTAYDQHAVAAFEEGAVDYVLKPFETDRLARAVRRVEQRMGEAPANMADLLRELVAARGSKAYLHWINASQGSAVRLLTVDEVLYFQADTGYTRVVTADGQWLIRKSLKELADELDPSSFWMIHRRTIVNANAIRGVSRDLRGRVFVTLKSGNEKLPVSDTHVHLFRQM